MGREIGRDSAGGAVPCEAVLNLALAVGFSHSTATCPPGQDQGLLFVWERQVNCCGIMFSLNSGNTPRGYIPLYEEMGPMCVPSSVAGTSSVVNKSL